MDEWIATAVGKLHTNKIKHKVLAEYLGVSGQYLSEILNGREVNYGAGTKERILGAIDEIIANKSIQK